MKVAAALLAIALGLLALSSCGQSSRARVIVETVIVIATPTPKPLPAATASPTPRPAPTPKQTTSTQPKMSFSATDPASQLRLTVDRVHVDHGQHSFGVNAGRVALLFRLTYHDGGSSSVDVQGGPDVSVVDSSGNVYSNYAVVTGLPSTAATLQPGQTTSGWWGIQVPKSVTHFSLSWQAIDMNASITLGHFTMDRGQTVTLNA